MEIVARERYKSRRRKTQLSGVDQVQITSQDEPCSSSDRISTDLSNKSSGQSINISVKRIVDEEPSESLADELVTSVNREQLIVDQIKSMEIESHTTEHESTESNSTISEECEHGSAVKSNQSQVETLEAPLSKRQQEKYNFEKFLNANKQILSTLESIDSIPYRAATAAQTNFKSEPQQSIAEEFNIKPYTEQQLKSLYCNSELDVLEEFTKTYIDTELKSIHLKKHYLYDLLVHYLKVREKITGNHLEIAQLRKEYHNLQNDLWTSDTATVKATATCQDGRVVTTTHQYKRSIFHRSIFQNIVRILGKVQKLVYENHVLYSFSAEDFRLQIILYIDQVITNVVTVTNLDARAPVSLDMKECLPYVKAHINEVRTSISILFAFQRKLIKDKIFIEDARNWLTQLVAVLIRVANYQDHLFLIHHILRCPAGVSAWATTFIQVPLHLPIAEPFANYEVNHLLCILSVILSPVKERKEFLKDIAHCQNQASETSWVLVDSDGEEDDETGISLRENDLVAILNQIPLADMFRCILLISRSDDVDQYNSHVVSEHHILRYFAFSSALLRLIHQGLDAYCLPKYNQFSKRLSRFIRHVIQYTTDQWEIFLQREYILDRAMHQRLQAEYDALFLRAIYYLYSSQKLRGWQFLAVVPYNVVSTRTLWKIYYILHMPDEKADDIINFSLESDFKKMVWEKDLRDHFEEKLTSLDDAEVYYLLNTFANMALARTGTDVDFIYSCTMDILQVGFISQVTQESCSKSSRILLSHLLSKHPSLLSAILKKVQENVDRIGSLVLYLYEDIPLSIWNLAEEDYSIIERLLLNYPAGSNQTKLARMILSRLNWDLLSYEKHCATAILVLKAVDQEPSYLQWGWQTILRLKLHISDRHFEELGRVQEIERCDVLLKGVRDNQPLASFVAVLMTTWGHLVPLICNNGLKQLIVLQSHQKHEAVLFALYQIVPIFITCQECLINSNTFQEILVNLLNADRGYISYAKSFIITQNTVLQQFGNMVETQIVNYAAYDLLSPRLLVRLWMNSLVSIPDWSKDNGVLYLLDVIVRGTFFYEDGLQVIYENLWDLYHTTTPQESASLISRFKWASSGSKSGYSLIQNSLAQYPWLAFIFLEVEHQVKEANTALWMELLKELSEQKGKISVDNSIKKATSTLKISTFSSSYLSIYRWSQQALDTPLDHPLLPLFWQKFFILFLDRLPVADSTGKNCIGERFFDGIVNFTFLKRLKRRLQESADYFRNQIEVASDEADSDLKNYYQLRHRLFEAFLLWLEEPRLQAANLLLQSLPAQYDPKRLALIIHENSKVPWYEYVNRNQLSSDQSGAMKQWRIANFREKSSFNRPLSNPGRSIESTDPVERIIRRLGSYDVVKPAPELTRKRVFVPVIDTSNKQSMFKSFQPCFKTLSQFAHNNGRNQSEQKALDDAYQELIPQLFTSVMKRISKPVPCKGNRQQDRQDPTILCSGPAMISIEFQEAKQNERVDHEILVNRQAYESLLEKSLQMPPVALYTASVAIQQCIRELQERLKTNSEMAELGVELFYHLLTFLQDEIVLYLPARSLFVSCIEKLGQSHICGVESEMPRLLQLILKEPSLGGYLAPYFLPKNCDSANILLMYSTIIHQMSKEYDVVFALISKFDVESWLNQKTPNLSQRTEFIGNIIQALSILGYDPPVDTLTLHGLYRKHLVTVFEFEFPEHYGEILIQLLKSSNGTPENNLIAESVWIDILNSLAKPSRISLKAPLREQLRQYSQYQKVLSHQELLETCSLFSRHFTEERLSYGLYGLFPKCRKYVDIFALMLGMSGHGLIVSMLNTHQGLLGDKLSEQIWPYVRDMFAPWLIPYSVNSLKDNMANWIQQLADDRSVLLPWIPADRECAEKMLKCFCECIHFLLDALPASFNILSYVFQWYASSFAHTSVKEYILIPVHNAFIAFPWNKFWPSMIDLEFMLRVIDQYLPECHSFLGYIFMSIPWVNWMNSFADAPAQIKSRVYYCFLSLLVKLSVEPKMRMDHLVKARAILIQAENFDWAHLEPVGFQHIMDWVVMSCNSNVIFKNDVLDLDYRLLCLLKLVSGYNKSWPDISMELKSKRQIYVRAHTKLLSVHISRNKNFHNIREDNVRMIINGYLNDLECVVTTADEMEMLLKEIISTVNISEISKIVLNVLIKWVENKTSEITIKAFLRTMGTIITDYKHLGFLYEATLTSYFNTNVIGGNFEDPPTWRKVSKIVNICPSKPLDFEQALLDEGCILTLNVVLLQRVYKNADPENLLNHCLGWLERIKLRNGLESKMPLIWFAIVNLALHHCVKDEGVTGGLLRRFCRILLLISEDAGPNNWGRGLLTAIGLSKTEAISLNFRFICRAMAGYVLAQLPDIKGSSQKVRLAANAACAIGTPGGNTECPKVLLELDFGQSQGKIKDCAEVALAKIQDQGNSMHNANSFLKMLLKQFYIKPYLKGLDNYEL